jgi:hypothetical protein
MIRATMAIVALLLSSLPSDAQDIRLGTARMIECCWPPPPCSQRPPRRHTFHLSDRRSRQVSSLLRQQWQLPLRQLRDYTLGDDRSGLKGERRSSSAQR